MAIRIAIIGYGKIARDQHIPSIEANPDYKLTALVTPSGDPGIGLPWFASHAELYAALAGKIDAIAICTPPPIRFVIARDALLAGLDVLLEKPPTATLGELEQLEALARAHRRTLYTAWHSQHAAAVPRSRELLAGADIASVQIRWFEDVRKWHPGQEWIWAPGGFGVLDPGINALSIATRILPMPLLVREARLLVPANRQAPIAASLSFGDGLSAEMDWRYTQGEQWTIGIERADGCRIELRDGGARLLIDGAEQAIEARGEYPSIYADFAALVAARAIEVDREPLRIAADAFLVGHREPVEAFV
jgi:D-galactose 1-dehydrogenase